jgi:hypothetical protein
MSLTSRVVKPLPILLRAFDSAVPLTCVFGVCASFFTVSGASAPRKSWMSRTSIHLFIRSERRETLRLISSILPGKPVRFVELRLSGVSLLQ